MVYLTPEHANTVVVPKGPHKICFNLPVDAAQLGTHHDPTGSHHIILTLEIQRKKITKSRKLSPSFTTILPPNIPDNVRRFGLPCLDEHGCQLKVAAFADALGDNVETLMAEGNKSVREREDDGTMLSNAYDENESEMLFTAESETNDEDTDMLLTSDDVPETFSSVFPSVLTENHSDRAFEGSQLVYNISHDQVYDRRSTPHRHTHSINSHDMLFDAENTSAFFSDEADMIRSDNRSAGNVQVVLPPQQKKRTLSVAFSNVGTSHSLDDGFSVDDFISIVDAAFRYAICDKPNNLRAGIKIRGNTMKSKLHNINPAVWSPGYAQAVATRASLIPTLASSFSKFVSNVRTAEYKTKFEKINGGQKAVETMSAFLLEMAQRDLQDHKAARKLKPLRRSSEKSVTITTLDSAFDDHEFLESNKEMI